MACADCGKKAAAGLPCRTFTFPLGVGSVDIVVQGNPDTFETLLLKEYAEVVVHVMNQLSQRPTEETHG